MLEVKFPTLSCSVLCCGLTLAGNQELLGNRVTEPVVPGEEAQSRSKRCF